MTLDQLLPYIIAILSGLLVVVVAYAVQKYLRQNSLDENFQAQFEAITRDPVDAADEELLQKEKGLSILDRWNRGWDRSFKAAGFKRYAEDPNRAGTDMLILSLVLMVAASIFAKNILAGVFGVVIGMSIVGMMARSAANKKIARIDEQLNGFLFSFKANIQSGMSNEISFINIVDKTKDPLKSELIPAKNDILSSKGFVTSLMNLRAHTPSKDLQFLCSCLIQGTQSGSGLENQIDKIQDVMKSRREINNKIEVAMKEPQPAIWLSSFILPALFIYSYTTSPPGFWFVNPWSWLALAGVAILYFIGIFVMRKMVDKIKNL